MFHFFMFRMKLQALSDFRWDSVEHGCLSVMFPNQKLCEDLNKVFTESQRLYSQKIYSVNKSQKTIWGLDGTSIKLNNK